MKKLYHCGFCLIFILMSGFPASAGDTAVVYLTADDSLAVGTVFPSGSRISTQNGLTLRLSDGSHLELDEKTHVRYEAIDTTILLHLRRGAVRSTVTAREGENPSYKVITPVAVAGVRGTDFSVSYDPGNPTSTVSDDDYSEVDVFEGIVEVEQNGKVHRIERGNGLTATRRAIKRREVKEKIRERWENIRGRVIDHVRNRYNMGNNPDNPQLKKFLENLPPHMRDDVKKKIKDRVKKRIQQHMENNSHRRPNQKTPLRDAIKKRRQNHRK